MLDINDRRNLQDKNEVMKLVKTLTVRCTEIILQSRDGSKVYTTPNLHPSSNNPFQISFKEFDVDTEMKKYAGVGHFENQRPLCIEVYLKTADDDVMLLEAWSIALQAETCEYTKSYGLYNRLGIMLKSLIAISRVLPAYGYACRQNPSTFIVRHRCYTGQPQVHLLGENYKRLRIGKVGMPVGTFALNVAYRTVMLISPQMSSIDSSIMVKSDHFRPPDFGKNDDNSFSLSDESPYRHGAFVESKSESIHSSDNDQLIPVPPFGKLMPNKKDSQVFKSPSSLPTRMEKFMTDENFPRVPRSAPEPIPVSKIPRNRCKSLSHWPPPIESSSNEDFILLDKPPFAESTGNVELGVFYQEWQTAPPLQACPNDPPVIEQIGDLTSQLQTYESNLKEFDNMVSSLCINSEGIMEESY